MRVWQGERFPCTDGGLSPGDGHGSVFIRMDNGDIWEPLEFSVRCGIGLPLMCNEFELKIKMW